MTLPQRIIALHDELNESQIVRLLKLQRAYVREVIQRHFTDTMDRLQKENAASDTGERRSGRKRMRLKSQRRGQLCAILR